MKILWKREYLPPNLSSHTLWTANLQVIEQGTTKLRENTDLRLRDFQEQMCPRTYSMNTFAHWTECYSAHGSWLHEAELQTVKQKRLPLPKPKTLIVSISSE